MHISDLTANPKMIIEQIRSSSIEQLRPGQVIEAKVLSAGGQNGVKLQIGDSAVLARTQLSLSVGERLTLSVAKASNPLELKVLREKSMAEVQARVFRAALPIQAPLNRLINLLQTLPSRSGLIPRETPTPAKPPVQVQPSPPEAPMVGPQRQAAQSLWNPRRPAALPSDQLQPIPAARPAKEAAANHSPSDAKASTQRQEAVDRDLMPALQRILSHRLSADESLNSARLRQAFEQSGLLLESRLAGGTEPVNDLKASLLQLLFKLRARLGMPPGAGREIFSRPDAGQQTEAARQVGELLAQTESSLARVLLNQLRSAGVEDGQKQMWHFELPVHQTDDSDNFRLSIGKEMSNRKEENETIWSVRLDFDLPPLGPVSTHLTLIGDVISSHFTAARRDSARRLEQAMPQLNEAFVRAGLKVGKLTACEGKIEQETVPSMSLAPLLDERA